MKWSEGDRHPTTLIDVVIVFCTTINVGLFLFYLGIR